MTINAPTLRHIILPIRLGVDPMERQFVATFKNDPEFEGLEPQVFDDPINGRGMKVLLYLPRWSESAGKFHKPVSAFEFRFAVMVLTAMSVFIMIVFYMTGKQSIACYLFFVFNFGMLLNVFFPHLAATIVLKKYCPGLLTGVALLVPATSYLLFYGYYNEFYSFPKFWFITIPFAVIIIVSIPILFKIGKLLQHGENNQLCIKK